MLPLKRPTVNAANTADISNKQSRTVDKWWASSSAFGEGRTTPTGKNQHVPMLHGHNRLLHIYTHHQLLYGPSDQRGRDGRSMWHARREMHVGFWRGNLKERDHLEVSELKWILRQYDGRVRNGLITLRIGTSRLAVTKRRVWYADMFTVHQTLGAATQQSRCRASLTLRLLIPAKKCMNETRLSTVYLLWRRAVR